MSTSVEFLQWQMDRLTEVKDGSAMGLRWVDEYGQTVTETILPAGVFPNLVAERKLAEAVAERRSYSGSLIAENIFPNEAQERLDHLNANIARLAMGALK